MKRAGDLLPEILPDGLTPPDPSKPQAKPGKVSKRVGRRIEHIQRIHADRTNETQKLGYLARPFILCGLPFKPKKGMHIYKRENGDEVLEIHASPEYGLPFGADIQVLVWVSTLAVLGMKDNGGQIPRVIEFRSGADFLRAFGLPLDGRTYKRAQERFLRIFYSTFFYGPKAGKRAKLFSVRFFDEIDLWFTRDLDTAPLPGDDFKNNRIVLSESFADDLQRHHPPLELNALAAWSDKPAQLYFYLWLVFRCYLARGRSEIALMGSGSVYDQCGVEGYGDPKRGPRNFRMKVKHWLQGVKGAWPECPVRLVTDDPRRGDYLVVEHKALAIQPSKPK
jgi:hypothetical protein